MNISVNPKDNPFLINNNSKFKSNIQSGSIITGVITSTDENNTMVKFDNNTKIKFEGGLVEGNNGDKVSFEIVGNSQNKLVLKQIKTVSFSDTLNVQQNMKNANVQELYEKAGMAQDPNKSDEEQSADKLEEQKLALAMMLLKRNLRMGNANNSKAALSALISSGIDVSKVSLSTMSKVISTSRTNNIPDKTQSELQALQKTFEAKGNSPADVSTKMQIAKEMNRSGLAVNESNVEQVDKFLKDVKELQSATIDTSNLLKNNMDLSVKNLLSSKHSYSQTTNPVPEGLESNIKSLLKEINVEVNAKTVETAKNFIANEVDITAENFAKLEFVQSGFKNLDLTTLIHNAIDQIRNGEPVSDLDLSKLTKVTSPIDYNNIVEQLNQVGSNTISNLTNTSMPITIENLLNNLQTENTASMSISNFVRADITVQSAFATKRQLIEIQLRMTTSVMFTLNKSNIDITTQPLIEALNNIKDAENQVYSNTLTQMGADNTNANIELISQTFDAVYETKATVEAFPENNPLQSLFSKISSVTSFVPELFSGENPITLSTISSSISQMARAYDENIANPNPKFADSFAKVSEQIAPLLETLGITPTDSKIKAGSVLVKNNLEITQENVEKVESINLKVERLLEKLTPTIASKMLSEGFNPLTEDIDSMLNYVDAFNDVSGSNANDNLVKELIKMEKDKTVDESTLDGIKAIYRALNTINKNGLSAVGQYIDTNRELTLNSLLDGAKTFSQTKGKYSALDKTISDNTTLSQTFTIGQSIKDLINQNVSTERTYLQEQVARFMDNANYEGLKQLIEENPNVYDEVLETVTEKLVDINKTNKAQDLEFLQQVVNEVLNANPETVMQLAKSNLTVNKKNLDTLEKMKEDKSYPTKTIQQLFNAENIDVTELTDIAEKFNNDLMNTANQNLTTLLENTNVDIKSLQLYGEVMNILSMQNALNSSSELAYKSYPIKLPISSEITNLQMYVLNEDVNTKEEVNIAFALNLSNGGEVNATAKYNTKTETLDVNIVCENDNFAKILQNNETELINIFKSFADNNIKVSIS